MIKRLHQSQISKQAAQENIDRKLAILRDWLKSGIPYVQDDSGNTLLDAKERKVLEYFPASVRQFKLWDGTQNSLRLHAQLPPISVTGNDTLAKRQASAEQAARITKALKLRANTQQNEGRHSTLRRLEQELNVANQTIGLRLAELREQRRSLRGLARENARLTKEHSGHTEELRRQLEQTEAMLAQERQRNAELTVIVNKLSPMRRSLSDFLCGTGS